MMISEVRRRLTAVAGLGILIWARPAAAADMWADVQRMFQANPMNAWDYIMLVLGPLIGAAFYFLYYRKSLLKAVLNMRTPSSVRWRAACVGLATALLVLMLSPHLPVGYLLIFALTGGLIAVGLGLAPIWGVLIGLVAITLTVLWLTGYMKMWFGQ